MRKEKVVLCLLVISLLLLSGCINFKVELEPKRNKLFDMTITITSEEPMVQGMIYGWVEDSSDGMLSRCEKLEKGILCSAENLLIDEDENFAVTNMFDSAGNLPIGEDGTFAVADMFEYISYTKKNGFPKNTFRMEFKSNSSSTDEKSSAIEGGDMSPEEMGMTMEIVIKPFGSIKKTNCMKISGQNAVSCNALKDKIYYVMWDDWFFMSWFSGWFSTSPKTKLSSVSTEGPTSMPQTYKATPSQPLSEVSTSTAQPTRDAVPNITEEEHQLEILATATHATVDTSGGKNWDADLEDDGIIIYPGLEDAGDEILQFDGVELTVDIEIWTTKMDDDLNDIKDRLIYSGSGTIDSWEDGNFLSGGGIRVSFEDINVLESDRDYGALYIKIHTLGGQVFEAKYSGIRIKPEKI